MSSVGGPGLADTAKQKNKAARNGYRAKELAQIRNSLRPFEQGEQIFRNSLRQLNGEQISGSDVLRQLSSEQLRQLNSEQLRLLTNNSEQSRLFNGEHRLNNGDVRLNNGDVRLHNGDVRLHNGDVRQNGEHALRQQFDAEQQLRPFDADHLRQFDADQLRQFDAAAAVAEQQPPRTVSSLSEGSSGEGAAVKNNGGDAGEGISAQETLQDTLNKLALMGYDEVRFLL